MSPSRSAFTFILGQRQIKTYMKETMSAGKYTGGREGQILKPKFVDKDLVKYLAHQAYPRCHDSL